MHKHCTVLCTLVKLSMPIFHSCFVDFMLANILEDGSITLLCRVPNFTPSIFCITLLLPTSEIYSAFVVVWDNFVLQDITSSRLIPSLYWSAQFLNRNAKMMTRSLIFKHHPEPRHLWRTFLQPHTVCRPLNLIRIYSTTFSLLQCLHSHSCILSEQCSCCLFKATAPTQ